MINSKVAKRYAQAFFSVSKDQNILDVMMDDMSALGDCLSQSQEMQAFVRNPILRKEERMSIVRHVFEGKVHLLLITFLMFLIEKNRLNLLGDVIESFKNIYKLEKKIVDVYLQVERSMEPSMLNELTQRISQRIGQKVNAIVTTNPDLLGGFKLRIGDDVCDASLRMQLNKFKERVLLTV